MQKARGLASCQTPRFVCRNAAVFVARPGGMDRASTPAPHCPRVPDCRAGVHLNSRSRAFGISFLVWKMVEQHSKIHRVGTPPIGRSATSTIFGERVMEIRESVTLEQCTVDPPPDLPAIEPQYTYQEIANLKRVKVQTIMEWVKRGRIPSPIYTGFTARFSQEQLVEIMTGKSKPGTFPVTPSPRSEIGKLGGGSVVKKKGKARNAAQQKRDSRPLPKPKPLSPRRRPAPPSAKHTKASSPGANAGIAQQTAQSKPLKKGGGK